jgi:hypothetical protein
VQEKYPDLISKVDFELIVDDREKTILKNYAGAVNTLGKIHMRKAKFNQAV